MREKERDAHTHTKKNNKWSPFTGSKFNLPHVVLTLDLRRAEQSVWWAYKVEAAAGITVKADRICDI